MYATIPGQVLDEPTPFAKAVSEYQKNALDPANYDEYTNWLTDQQVNFDNFMKLTTQPQNNPFGITGNKEAMQRLEIQKPLRDPTSNNPFMNVPISDYNIPEAVVIKVGNERTPTPVSLRNSREKANITEDWITNRVI